MANGLLPRVVRDSAEYGQGEGQAGARAPRAWVLTVHDSSRTVHAQFTLQFTPQFTPAKNKVRLRLIIHYKKEEVFFIQKELVVRLIFCRRELWRELRRELGVNCA